jgi:hypothetical protein
MVRALAFAATAVVAAIASWSHVLLDEPSSAGACGDAGPFDFDTIEPAMSDLVYTDIINLATQGSLVAGEFSAGGETVNLQYQGLLSGPRQSRTTTPDTSLRIPPSVYYAIAWVEANWANASHAVPWGGVGPTLRSFDCGYGIGQITTGMRNNTGIPTAKQALVGTHPGFNVAEGIRILADKWNSAPEFRPIAGNGDPAALEDWYYAIWSYNGFAFINHPFHPERDPLRNGNGIDMIYHCYDGNAPSYIDVGGELPLYAYGDYTYPERVYGCMRFPPDISPLRNPDREGETLWQPVEFNMPFFHREEVAAVFAPEVWQNCDVLIDGCAAMDFPTSFEELNVVPHNDPVQPVDPALALQVFGQPFLSIQGPTTADLEILDSSGVSESVRVTVTNSGSWLGVYRVRSSVPWLVARHPGDQVGRTLDAGIAVGAETEIVVIASPLRTRAGYAAEIDIALDWRQMALGSQQGSIVIEPLWGTGEPLAIAVTGSTAFEAPPEPTPTPTPTSQPPQSAPTATPVVHDAHAPGLAVSE